MNQAFSQTRIYQLLILALAVLLLWKWNCGGSSCPQYTDTVKRDTVYLKRADSSNWSKPEPVRITKGKVPSSRPVVTQRPDGSGRDTVYLPIDTAAILAGFYDFKDYDTTYSFKEGTIRVQNSVTQNSIQAQRVLPTFNIPQVTTTITKIEKKRGQVYVGIDGYGGPTDPLYGAGATIMYKTKRDKVYEIGPVLFKDQPPMIRAGVKFLISFRK